MSFLHLLVPFQKLPNTPCPVPLDVGFFGPLQIKYVPLSTLKTELKRTRKPGKTGPPNITPTIQELRTASLKTDNG